MRVLCWGVRAAASPPTPLPVQYYPALPWVTTRFGMDTEWFHGALSHAHSRADHASKCLLVFTPDGVETGRGKKPVVKLFDGN